MGVFSLVYNWVMKQIVEKQVVEELMKNPDQIRGVDFKTDKEFILKKEGEEGKRRVEQKVSGLLGRCVEYDEFGTMDFYPLGTRTLFLLVAKKIFNFSEREVKQMGRQAPQFSLLVKILMKFFKSVSQIKKEVSRMWSKYHTTGELKLITPDMDFETIRTPGHSVVLKLLNHKIHPLYCTYLSGYFERVTEMVLNASSVTCKEVKCPFLGDEHHEFSLKW